MPVGTYGTVKGVMPRIAATRWARRSSWATPSTCGCARAWTCCEQFGGLHRFESWNKPILTDSGGFQVWRLGEMRKISEEGVKFASPVNGDKLFLTPEISMQIQTRAEQRHRHAVRRVHALRHQGPHHHRGRGAHVDGAEPALGAALQGRVRAAGEPERAVRHRAGRHVRAPARGIAGRAGRDGLPRLCHRRRQRGRAQGRDAAHHGAHAAPAAGRTSRAT